jgi:uncharacterized protein YdiU (UPF0061 family)
MRLVNPKYVPRESMLVDAYMAANAGDFSAVHELHALLKAPYAEQPDMEAKYYQKSPLESSRRGGTGFMS